MYDEDRPESSRYPIVAARLDMNRLRTRERVLPGGRVHHTRLGVVGTAALSRRMHGSGGGLAEQGSRPQGRCANLMID